VALAPRGRGGTPGKKRPKTPAAPVLDGGPLGNLPVGMRLFCFPWEGGGANVFEGLSWEVKTAQVRLKTSSAHTTLQHSDLH